MADAKKPKMITVKARARGQYQGVMKSPGDVFQIPEAIFSKRWLVKYTPPKVAPDEDA